MRASAPGEVDARDLGRARRPRRRARTTRRRPRTTITSAIAPPSTERRRRRARPRRSRAPVASFGNHASAAGPPASSSTAAAIAVGTYGPGRARPAELLDHHRLLDETEPAPPCASSTCSPIQPRLDERGPERRARLGGRRRAPSAARGGRDAVVDEAADGLAQVLVLFGDPDRHAGDGRRDAPTIRRQFGQLDPSAGPAWSVALRPDEVRRCAGPRCNAALRIGRKADRRPAAYFVGESNTPSVRTCSMPRAHAPLDDRCEHRDRRSDRSRSSASAAATTRAPRRRASDVGARLAPTSQSTSARTTRDAAHAVPAAAPRRDRRGPSSSVDVGRERASRDRYGCGVVRRLGAARS